MSKNKNSNGANEPIEKQLWKSADKLRKNIDAAEYKQFTGKMEQRGVFFK